MYTKKPKKTKKTTTKKFTIKTKYENFTNEKLLNYSKCCSRKDLDNIRQ